MDGVPIPPPPHRWTPPRIALVFGVVGVALLVASFFLPLSPNTAVVNFRASAFAWLTQGIFWLVHFFGIATLYLVGLHAIRAGGAKAALGAGMLVGGATTFLPYSVAASLWTVYLWGFGALGPGVYLMFIGNGLVLAAGSLAWRGQGQHNPHGRRRRRVRGR
jgi:hypothetical protein